MKITRAVCALFILSACGTPQQQCIGGVTQDLQGVDRLTAETKGNLVRGYADADTVITRPEFVDSTPEPTSARPLCAVPVALGM